MVTANLSVGIKTDDAKRGLAELKQWMAQEMRGVVLSINETALTNSLQAALKKQRFSIAIDDAALTGQVDKALKSAFSTQHRVSFDSASLTAQVKQAVDAGLGGAKLPGTSTKGSHAGLTSDVAAELHRVLVPAVDELVRAAAAMKGAAIGGAPRSTGRASARQGFSTTDRETGERLGYSKTLENPDEQLLIIKRRNDVIRERAERLRAQAETQKAELKAEQEFLQDRKVMHRVANLELVEQSRLRAAAEAEVQRQQLARTKAAVGRLVIPKSSMDGNAKGSFDVFDQAGLIPKIKQVDDVAAAHARVRSAMNDAHSAARGLAGSLGMLWVTWGSTIPIVAAAALGATLRSVFTVGKDLEYQLTFVATLSNSAAVSMTAFGNAVRGSMVAPVEASKAMRALAQNGLDATEAMTALPVVLRLATAGEMDLTAAALGATGVMAAFNLQVGDLGRVGDVFAKAAAMSNTSVSAMVEAMKQASTVSDQYHVSIEETAASLAVLAKRNIEGSAAGTAFRKMMSDLAAPTDHARIAMEKIGLSVFNADKSMKPFVEVVNQLRDVTVTMNEKSRIVFLQDIFDERGAKAANALLSDFGLLNTILGDLKTNSNGFAQGIVDSLSETTEGKIKRMVSEFQLGTTAAFNEVSSAVRNLLDQMSSISRSDEFKRAVTSLSEGVVNLTKFLIEHAKVIGITVAAWVALRVAMLAAAGIGSLITALKAVEVGLIGLRTAALAVGGALSGGLFLVTALAAEYFLLHDSVDKVTEAEKARTNSIDLYNESVKRDIENTRERVKGLFEEINAIYKGVDATNARREADARLRKDKITDMRNELLKAQEALGAAPASGTPNAAQGDPLGLMNADFNRQRLKDAVARKQEQLDNMVGDDFRSRGMSELERFAVDRKSLLNRLEAYNKDAQRIAEMTKGKTALERLPLIIAQRLPNEQLKAELDRLDRARNTAGTNYSKTDPQDRRNDLALSRQIIDDLRERETATKQAIKFVRELNQATYNSDAYGPYLAAKVQEQEATKELLKLQKLETDSVAELNQAKRELRNLTTSDRTNIDTEIKRRQSSIKTIEREIEQRTALMAIQARNAAMKDQEEDSKVLKDLSVTSRKQLLDTKASYDTRVDSGGDVAARAAEMKLEAAFANEILKREVGVEKAKERVLNLAEQIDVATKDELAELTERHAIQLAYLDLQEATLTNMKRQLAEAKKINGEAARNEFDKSQTAEYGWRSFWKKYQEGATSAAKAVEDVMKVTTDGMSAMIVRFVTTGKMGFKSFAQSVAAEAARILSTRAIMQLLQMGFAFFSGGGNWSNMPDSFANANSGGAFESGGVMTSYGKMPLNSYLNGGIGYSPQVALFAEGRKPEAYVPLPDGRTIPVTMQGGGSGACTINTNVYVQADGSSKVSSDVNGAQGKALGAMIEGAVVGVIVREKRAGGLLAA